MNVLAHQGGWDEFLLVIGPVLLIMGGILWWSWRKERAAPDDEEADGDPDGDGRPADPSGPPADQ